MPITKSAKKKVRQDEKRRKTNLKIRKRVVSALKKARENPSEENVRQATSVFDRAAKKKIIHRNKAARLKSKLLKLTVEKRKDKLKTPSKKKRERKP